VPLLLQAGILNLKIAFTGASLGSCHIHVPILALLGYGDTLETSQIAITTSRYRALLQIADCNPGQH
jgi:hypothetical protein